MENYAEMQEAIESRYNKTINRHRWTNLDNIKLSTSEIVAKYISECDEEDAGIYRNHTFNLTSYQKHWHSWLMQKEYKYMITIKLPHYEIDGFKRTTNQKKAIEQLRKLIREIEQAYTGHKHFERDAFDFNLVFINFSFTNFIYFLNLKLQFLNILLIVFLLPSKIISELLIRPDASSKPDFNKNESSRN